MKWPVSLVAGAVLSVLFVVVALLSFVWTPHDVATLAIADKLQPPSPTYWLGTDHFGRDTLSMLMVGARTSIAVAIVAVGIGIVVGVPLGLAAAANLIGGVVDDRIAGQDEAQCMDNSALDIGLGCSTGHAAPPFRFRRERQIN